MAVVYLADVGEFQSLALRRASDSVVRCGAGEADDTRGKAARLAGLERRVRQSGWRDRAQSSAASRAPSHSWALAQPHSLSHPLSAHAPGERRVIPTIARVYVMHDQLADDPHADLRWEGQRGAAAPSNATAKSAAWAPCKAALTTSHSPAEPRAGAASETGSSDPASETTAGGGTAAERAHAGCAHAWTSDTAELARRARGDQARRQHDSQPDRSPVCHRDGHAASSVAFCG